MWFAQPSGCSPGQTPGLTQHPGFTPFLVLFQYQGAEKLSALLGGTCPNAKAPPPGQTLQLLGGTQPPHLP